MTSPTRTGPRARGLRPALIRIGLALGIPVLAVLAIEGGARLYLGDALLNGLPSGEPLEACAVPDPELGWVNKPGVRTRIEGPHMSYAVEINSRGLRDREHPHAKPDGVFRIALLGDSLAWGWGVDNGLAFADLVEEELGPGVEVINLGVPGYSTDQELWTLQREGRRYSPDLVLLAFILNDVPGNSQLESGELRKPRYARAADGGWALENPLPPGEGSHARRSLNQWLWVHSGLLQLLRPIDTERELAREGSGSGNGPRGRRVPTEAQASMQASEQAEVQALAGELTDPESVTSMLLARLAEECRELQVPLVAFSIAHHHDRYLYSPTHPLPPQLPEGELLTALSRSLAEAGRRIGFATFAVDRAMLAETQAGVRLAGSDGHLDAEGNRVVAGRIAEELGPLIPGRGAK
jgi:lysophospholipase L1-like esterase